MLHGSDYPRMKMYIVLFRFKEEMREMGSFFVHFTDADFKKLARCDDETVPVGIQVDKRRRRPILVCSILEEKVICIPLHIVGS